MDEPVRYAVVGQVAHLTLNRPQTGNRIDAELARALAAACTRAEQDDQARIVVLLAAGNTFSLGSTDLYHVSPVASALALITKPTLCALNGDTLGQGLELALACDLRIATESVRLALDQLCAGAFPSDGGTQRLPRLIGRSRAMELLLTGRRLDATEAKRLGLVHEVVPSAAFAQRVDELADRLATMAPIAAAYVKEAANQGIELPLEAGLRLEADLAVLLHTSKDRAEGLAAFLNKRRPHFTGE